MRLSSQIDGPAYKSGLEDAEPLDRYGEGGYHPVHIGDTLQNGRYKITQKLGFGGFSTVWAAKDQIEANCVALKISISALTGTNREVEIMRTIDGISSVHPGRAHVMHMIDHFQLEGPNGIHDCLVLDLMGPNMQVVIDACPHRRLPGELAKGVARQALLGLDFLHKCNIGHGDLHTRNLALVMPSFDNDPSGGDILDKLDQPDIYAVSRKDGGQVERTKPAYLVRSASFPVDLSWFSQPVKIIDFGESFLKGIEPNTLNTPLGIRAPEIIFKDQLDYRVDLWSLGCLLFEILVGQLPFDTILATPTRMIFQILGFTKEALPQRWVSNWLAMTENSSDEDAEESLHSWLQELYFDEDIDPDFDREEMMSFGDLIGRLLHFEPGLRASAEEILHDPWFKAPKEAALKGSAAGKSPLLNNAGSPAESLTAIAI